MIQALNCGPAQRGKREEQCGSGRERHGDLDRQMAQLPAVLRNRELQIAPEEDRKLVGELAEKLVRRFLRAVELIAGQERGSQAPSRSSR